MAHVQGNDDGTGFGVEGTTTSGKGVVATSETDIGAFA
jgi:hypothetical protein